MFSEKLINTPMAQLGLFALGMGALLFLGTPWGLGLSPDSVSYVNAARGLLETGSLNALPSHWPPLYPLLLAGGQYLSGDISITGRFLQLCFIVANVFLIGRVLNKSGLQNWAVGALTLLISLESDFAFAHLHLWSEPAFLCLALLNLLLLERHLRDPENIPRFIALGIVTSLAIMVRYAGLFLIVLNIVALLVLAQSKRSITRRALDCLTTTLIALLPFIIWSIFNLSRGNTATNRSLVWHPLGAERLQQALGTLGAWFHLPASLGGISLVVLSAGAIRILITSKTLLREDTRMPQLLAIYALSYMTFMAASICLIDYNTPLDERILFPLLPAGIYLTTAFFQQISSKAVPLVLAGIALGVTLNIPRSLSTWQDSRQDGLGFASRHIQELQISDALRKLPVEWSVVTNGPEIFQLYLPQRATLLPSKLNATSLQPNPNFSQQYQKAVSTTKVLVYFSLMGYRTYLPDINEINATPGFKIIYAQKDGLIWVRPEEPAPVP